MGFKQKSSLTQTADVHIRKNTASTAKRMNWKGLILETEKQIRGLLATIQ